MNVNLFRNKDNKNYVTTRKSNEEVDKEHYQFLGELPSSFESYEGSQEDPNRLAIYTPEKALKKIEDEIECKKKDIKLLENVKEKLKAEFIDQIGAVK